MPCTVVAPSLSPDRQGDRVRTDKRDVLRLAQLFRAGELVAVFIPNEENESLRDLVRAREDAVDDRTRARHRLSKFYSDIIGVLKLSLVLWGLCSSVVRRSQMDGSSRRSGVPGVFASFRRN
ncbi:IS110 family transposase [Alicyclobacillus fastidiosus]|uniref:IS110 family transposase n=1 Tax=Alicyclobacillus fastidiosus TaxID=392011 RepID=UPI0034D74959